MVSVAPEIARKARRNVLLSGVAGSFPFYSMELCEQSGILIGRDRRSRSVCMLDIFDSNRYSNSNMVVLGMSGSGKTYLLQLIAMRYRQQGKQVFLIAPYKGADAQEDSRDLFINQVSADAAAKGLLDAAKQDLTSKGYGDDKKANIALVSSTGTDANQNAWQAAIEELLTTDDYSFMVIQNKDTDILYPGTDETKVNAECATLISRMGPGEDQIQAAIALSSMSTPALGAQYESAASKPDATVITLTGLATPNALKTYIKDENNPLSTGVLWNCMDLGYLAVQTAYQLTTGEITTDSESITAGRLGDKEITDRQVVLGDALVFDASNVDEFDY